MLFWLCTTFHHVVMSPQRVHPSFSISQFIKRKRGKMLTPQISTRPRLIWQILFSPASPKRFFGPFISAYDLPEIQIDVAIIKAKTFMCFFSDTISNPHFQQRKSNFLSFYFLQNYFYSIYQTFILQWARFLNFDFGASTKILNSKAFTAF